MGNIKEVRVPPKRWLKCSTLSQRICLIQSDIFLMAIKQMTLSVASRYVAETLRLKNQGWAESRELKCCLALFGTLTILKAKGQKREKRHRKTLK